MRFKKRYIAVLALLGALGHAEDNPTRISVTLFGQPCTLSGPLPLDDAGLKAIHSISPEQIPPELSLAKARESLDTLKKAGQLPSALDVYREQLVKRIQAQIAFHEGWSATLKSGRSQELLNAVAPYLAGRKKAGFEKAVKNLGLRSKASGWKQPELEALSISFEDAAPVHPEEEFHKAIRKMNVSYSCTFEEGEES